MAVNRNIVMTQNQMDNTNTLLGSFDGENTGQKYYSVNNGFYNYGELIWDALNAMEAVDGIIGGWVYGYEGTAAIPLGAENYMEPNPKNWRCFNDGGNSTSCNLSNNTSPSGAIEPVYFDIAATMAAVWEGRSENATINGTTRTKNEWSQIFANWVFDELVTRSADDKLDWSNGTNPYTTNTTFGTNIRYPQTGSNGGYIESYPIFQMGTQMKRYLLGRSLIDSQISDDAVITELSENSAGTKLQQVDYWLQEWGNYIYYWWEQEMDTWLSTSWRTQSNLTISGSVNVGYPASGVDQTHVYFNSSNVGFNRVSTLQSVTFNNRDWAAIAFLHAAGTFYNNTTWKNDTAIAFELFFKTHIFSDNSFAEFYRNDATLPDGGMNYWIVTMWEVVDFAFLHAVAVTNGVTGVTDSGKFINYSTSEGTDEVINGYVVDSTSGGTKNILNVLIENSKYYRTPANGGYLGDRYVEGGSILADPTDFRFGQIAALANSYLQNSDLEDYAQMSTSVGYSGQGYSGDGNGTYTIPNWVNPFVGPFGAWRPMIYYGDQTNIFTTQNNPSTPVVGDSAVIYLINP